MAITTVMALTATARGGVEIPEQACGVYTWCGYMPDQMTREALPNARGVVMLTHWNKLEPEEGVYKFDEFIADRLRRADADDFQTFLMTWVGPSCPDWLYEKGVPKVRTDRTVNALGQKTSVKTFPYYLHPLHKERFFKLLREWGKYYNALPDELRERIWYVQSAEGSTGDGQPYKGKPLDKQYDISREQWAQFRVETWQVLAEAFQEKTDRPLMLLVNNDANRELEHKWLLKTQSVIATKQGMFSHGYHVSDNRERLRKWRDVVASSAALGKATFTRGEMDGELYVMGWSKQNVPQALYWSALIATHCGLDQWNVPWQACADPANQDSLIFFNKYAGKREPSTAPSAFCALRRGLDASDTDLFPARNFGDANKRNIDRYLKIADAFSRYGAAQGDPPKATGGGMLNRKRDDYNDVGWGILPGNYERFLTQIDPDETSVGWWRRGPEQHINSRFARGFEAKTGKTAMRFRLDKDFFDDVSKPQAASVSVAYLDEGNGEWALRYRNASGEQTALAIECADTGQWLDKRVELNDALFNGKLRGDADLVIEHIKGDDVVFHMIEIDRVNAK